MGRKKKWPSASQRHLNTRREELRDAAETFAAAKKSVEIARTGRALEAAARSFYFAERILWEEEELERVIARAKKPNAPCVERDELDGVGPCEFILDEDNDDSDTVRAVCVVCGRDSQAEPETETRAEQIGYQRS